MGESVLDWDEVTGDSKEANNSDEDEWLTRRRRTLSVTKKQDLSIEDVLKSTQEILDKVKTRFPSDRGRECVDSRFELSVQSRKSS